MTVWPAAGPAALPAAPALALGPAEAHLWTWHADGTDDDRPHLPFGELDLRERARADAFLRPRDRLRYVTAHVVLRRVLAGYLGTEPARVEFDRAPCPRCAGPHGRPVLAGGAALHFSLSHSHGRTLLALARVRVGADVQRTPAAEAVELCLPAMHARERREIAGLPEDGRRAAFTRLWVRKEAYLKGLGTGVAHGTGTDYLGDDPTARPAGWLLADVPAPAGHAAAAALESDADHLVVLRTLPAALPQSRDVPALLAAAPEWRTTVRGGPRRPASRPPGRPPALVQEREGETS